MKYAVILLLTAAINVAAPVWLAPIVQKSATSHSIVKDQIVIACFFSGALAFTYGIRNRKTPLYAGVIALLAVSFFYWCHWLSGIECYQCSRA